MIEIIITTNRKILTKKIEIIEKISIMKERKIKMSNRLKKTIKIRFKMINNEYNNKNLTKFKSFLTNK